ITSRTRALLLINPNNPTGALYDTEILKQMLEVARQHKLLVISDEIYDRLVFAPKQHVSTAALADDLNVVTFNGLAKSHIICGFRCGWLAIRGVNGELESLRDAVERLASLRLCSNTLTQLVIPAALEDEASTRRMLTPEGRLYRQRQAVFDVLDQADGISYVPNDAAFYLFPKFDAKRFKVTDDRELAMGMLMEKHILIVPGSGFDYPYPDHFRIVMLPEAHVLSQATKDMVEYIQSRE
ncbi:MAG: aminotransferase class I/II-fold pyridoxal phosphate-dependent enzyme, partial [Clostridia bacterium]|nr:aminotransferase class I/II-fold pyridoxal phosphate-dependent enzyme [Clostridia bacterium]